MNFRSIRWKGVFAGLVVDVGGSMVAGFAIGIVLSMVLIKQGTAPDKIGEALLTNTFYLMSMLVIGLFFDALGGFISGAMNSKARLLNAFAMGALSLTLGSLMQLTSTSPHWYRLVTVLLVIPSALVGGLFSKLMPVKKEALPPELNS